MPSPAALELWVCKQLCGDKSVSLGYFGKQPVLFLVMKHMKGTLAKFGCNFTSWNCLDLHSLSFPVLSQWHGVTRSSTSLEPPWSQAVLCWPPAHPQGTRAASEHSWRFLKKLGTTLLLLQLPLLYKAEEQLSVQRCAPFSTAKEARCGHHHAKGTQDVIAD